MATVPHAALPMVSASAGVYERSIDMWRVMPLSLWHSVAMISGRRRKAVTFTVLGVCLVAAAITLNVSWLVLNWREGMVIVFGTIFCLVIIALGVVNTIFLVREIRRNEQHDSFINAVTHELKTPVASIRLYLETLQSRDIDVAKRQAFYGIMLDDTDRLLGTIEQVLRAGHVGAKARHAS